MTEPEKNPRGSLRPILERLEELVIESGLTGLPGVGEEMAREFDGLASRMSALPDGAGAAALSSQTAALLRRILADAVSRPFGFSDQLLEALAVFSDFAHGEDVTERLVPLAEALVPKAPADSQPPPPPPDVGRMFVVEATACLNEVERALLDLERGPLDTELLRELGRGLHNLKGSAGMAGHEDAVSLAHAMENQVLGLISDPAADRTRVVDTLLRGLDETRAIVEQLRLRDAETQAESDLEQAGANYLLFDTGGRRLAVRMADVSRVEKVPPTTPVPFTPPFVIGLVNLGGELLPMVDLALRLGFRPGVEETGRVLVVGSGEERIALKVDRVAEIVSLGVDRIEPLIAEVSVPELPKQARLEGEVQVPLLDARLVAAWLGAR